MTDDKKGDAKEPPKIGGKNSKIEQWKSDLTVKWGAISDDFFTDFSLEEVVNAVVSHAGGEYMDEIKKFQGDNDCKYSTATDPTSDHEKGYVFGQNSGDPTFDELFIKFVYESIDNTPSGRMEDEDHDDFFALTDFCGGVYDGSIIDGYKIMAIVADQMVTEFNLPSKYRDDIIAIVEDLISQQ